MEFRLLGSVEIESAGRLLPLPRRRERCLLAVLLLELNRSVPADRLGDLLWDGDPPPRMRRVLASYASRVRAVLSTPGADEPVAELIAIGGGYQVTADPSLVDVHRFRSLVAAAEQGAPPVKVDLLRSALRLWRGTPLAGSASDLLRERLCSDLEELRLAAMEDLVAGSLSLGRDRDALMELARLTREHPFRERLVELYMRVLHRAGRTGEALKVYARTRSRLADELGTEPGANLRDLHRQLLRGEPDSTTPAATVIVVPRQLPPGVSDFIGRQRELEQLNTLLPTIPTGPVVVTVAGPAGVGKTALALHWAHQRAGRFPDGQLYVNLRGFGPEGSPLEPADAVRRFLEALGVAPQDFPADSQSQVDLYRSLVAERSLLLVLDNAWNAVQVRPLLPGAAGSVTVVTSRHNLPGLVAADGAHLLMLDVLSDDDARRLLSARIGAARMASEPEAVNTVVGVCGGLPLALVVVAGRVAARPRFPLAMLAEQMRAASSGLDAWSGEDPATDVRAVLSWSYQALEPDAAKLFRLLGLHPGPDLTAQAAASLVALPVTRARRLLAALTDTHLLIESRPDRYTLHDLLRAFAAELGETVDSESDRRAAIHRMLEHYLHTADRAAQLHDPHRLDAALADPCQEVVAANIADRDGAVAWLTTERQVLVSLIQYAAGQGLEADACRLAWRVLEFLFRQGYWHDQAAVGLITVQAASRLADRSAQARAHRGVAGGYAPLGRHGEAYEHLQECLILYSDVGDQIGQAQAHLGIALLVGQQGDYQTAVNHGEQADKLFQATGDRAGQARALNTIGYCHTLSGNHRRALTFCEHALAICLDICDRLGAAGTLDSLGYAHHHLGNLEQAIICYQRALDLCQETDSLLNRAEILDHLGDVYLAAAQPTAARDAWQEGLELLTRIGSPSSHDVRAKLTQPADADRPT
jgi:DNA-binding SARP family transcriptional activator/tetratricopeptide (TPR) repeat protein